MAKSKRKQKKKNLKKEVEDLPVPRMIEEGRALLESEKAREAITIFKQALKEDKDSDELKILLFRSYILREEQLREKDMIREAENVRQLALKHLPNFQVISEDELIMYLSLSSPEEAVRSYIRYLSGNERSPRAEEVIAGLVFRNRRWKALDSFDEAHPLRKDGRILREAGPLMDRGEWAAALEALRGVPRHSPFAPVRLFCRGMAAFYNEDDASAHRAFSMLPGHFPLQHVVRSLKTVTDPAADPKQKSDARNAVAFLWDGPVNLEQDIQALIRQMESGKLRQAEQTIDRIAAAVYPDAPMKTRQFILETFWKYSETEQINTYQYRRFVSKVLPGEYVKQIHLKKKLRLEVFPLLPAAEYLQELKRMFPDPAARKLAHAHILLEAVKGISAGGIPHTEPMPPHYRKVADELGVDPETETVGDILIDLCAESIRIDPGNREVYETIVELPREGREARKKVETALLTMRDRFPDDPYPCLELADLYYESNAFRKAERILEEAMARAPHDSRVIDRTALASLIAVEKNLDRKKLHLVEQDIAAAAEIDSPRARPFVVEKEIIFRIMQEQETGGKPDIPGIVEEELGEMSLYHRLKILSLLLLDLQNRKISPKKKIVDQVDKIFRKDMKEIDTLPVPRKIDLMTPPHRMFRTILPEQNPVMLFLGRSKDLLPSFPNKDVLYIYDQILASGRNRPVMTDSSRRIDKAGGRDHLPYLEFVLLRFYEEVARQWKQKNKTGDGIRSVLSIADTPQESCMEEVRAVSRRLSRYAEEPLKEALANFDFSILDRPFFFDFFDFLDEEEEEEPPVEERGLIPPHELETFIQVLEEMETGTVPRKSAEEFILGIELLIHDDLQLTGAPEFIIESARLTMEESQPLMKVVLEKMRKLAQEYDLKKKLSREARDFLSL